MDALIKERVKALEVNFAEIGMPPGAAVFPFSPSAKSPENAAARPQASRFRGAAALDNDGRDGWDNSLQAPEAAARPR